MRDTAGGGRRQLSDQVARIGLEHVLLFYDYLDLGDLDSCMSLLDGGASFHLPLGMTAQGEAASGALARTHLSGRGTHRIRRRRTDGETIVVEGDFTDLSTLTTVGFTDLFGFSEHALISSWHRVHGTSRPPLP